MTPPEQLSRVQEQIAKAARRAGRNPETVTLVAVTKTVPMEAIEPFLAAGVQQVGENRVQEALGKYPARATGVSFPVRHLIGPLQSNKTRKAVEFFDVIQTLDRLDLAADIDGHARELGKKQTCLIQIKISTEPTKSGLEPSQLPDFLEQLRPFSGLHVRGLMGIPPLDAQGDAAQPYFKRLRALFEECRSHGAPDFDILSMGMSSDFETAIEEGSTMVRIGTALFGARQLQ